MEKAILIANSTAIKKIKKAANALPNPREPRAHIVKLAQILKSQLNYPIIVTAY